MRTGTRRSVIKTETAPRAAGETAGAEPPALLSEVDAALQRMAGRGLVDSIEVVDLLLDLRSRIVLEDAFAEMTEPKRPNGD